MDILAFLLVVLLVIIFWPVLKAFALLFVVILFVWLVIRNSGRRL